MKVDDNASGRLRMNSSDGSERRIGVHIDILRKSDQETPLRTSTESERRSISVCTCPNIATPASTDTPTEPTERYDGAPPTNVDASALFPFLEDSDATDRYTTDGTVEEEQSYVCDKLEHRHVISRHHVSAKQPVEVKVLMNAEPVDVNSDVRPGGITYVEYENARERLYPDVGAAVGIVAGQHRQETVPIINIRTIHKKDLAKHVRQTLGAITDNGLLQSNRTVALKKMEMTLNIQPPKTDDSSVKTKSADMKGNRQSSDINHNSCPKVPPSYRLRHSSADGDTTTTEGGKQMTSGFNPVADLSSKEPFSQTNCEQSQITIEYTKQLELLESSKPDSEIISSDKLKEDQPKIGSSCSNETIGRRTTTRKHHRPTARSVSSRRRRKAEESKSSSTPKIEKLPSIVEQRIERLMRRKLKQRRVDRLAEEQHEDASSDAHKLPLLSPLEPSRSPPSAHSINDDVDVDQLMASTGEPLMIVAETKKTNEIEEYHPELGLAETPESPNDLQFVDSKPVDKLVKDSSITPNITADVQTKENCPLEQLQTVEETDEEGGYEKPMADDGCQNLRVMVRRDDGVSYEVIGYEAVDGMDKATQLTSPPSMTATSTQAGVIEEVSSVDGFDGMVDKQTQTPDAMS